MFLKLSSKQALEPYRVVDMLRIPHCVYNLLTDSSGKVVSALLPISVRG
jgi:hypothetical protein